MAQHFRLNEKDEPKIFASVRRLGKYIRQPHVASCFHSFFHEDILYKKTVMRLPNEYNWEEAAPGTERTFQIGSYHFQSKDFKQYGLMPVECHFDGKGNIVAIFVAI